MLSAKITLIHSPLSGQHFPWNLSLRWNIMHKERQKLANTQANLLPVTAESHISHSSLLRAAEISFFCHFFFLSQPLLYDCVFKQKIAVQVLTASLNVCGVKSLSEPEGNLNEIFPVNGIRLRMISCHPQLLKLVIRK